MIDAGRGVAVGEMIGAVVGNAVGTPTGTAVDVAGAPNAGRTVWVGPGAASSVGTSIAGTTGDASTVRVAYFVRIPKPGSPRRQLLPGAGLRSTPAAVASSRRR